MLSFPTLTVTCPGCRGRGIVMDWLGDVRICPRCGGSGRAPMRVKRAKFDYSLPAFNFTANPSTQSQQLQLDDDAPFEMTAFSFGSTSGNGTFAGTATGILIQLSDLSTGWQFSNNPLMISNFASTNVSAGGPTFLGAAFPAPLVAPYIWMPSATVQATLTWSLTVLAQYVGQVTLKGYKLYAPDGSLLNLAAGQQAQQEQQAA